MVTLTLNELYATEIDMDPSEINKRLRQLKTLAARISGDWAMHSVATSRP